MSRTTEELLGTVRTFLEESGIEWEAGARDGELVVTLPGDKKLKTVCSLVATGQGLSLSAFVIRRPDENEAAFYRFLLRRNLRLPTVAYAVDTLGDVYLTGRLPTAGVDAGELDRLLGAVLDAADAPFNELLALGFVTSMHKEWAWRVSRGESLRNLEAFRSILQRDGDPGPD
ncbi:MAG: YbjN domain-containing protein [Nostocoides sp.]